MHMDLLGFCIGLSNFMEFFACFGSIALVHNNCGLLNDLGVFVCCIICSVWCCFECVVIGCLVSKLLVIFNV
jgi:hypothetical protein